jgi:hypothetical protein
MKSPLHCGGTAARLVRATTGLNISKPKAEASLVRCNRCRAYLYLKADGCLPIHKGFSGIIDCFSSRTQDFVALRIRRKSFRVSPVC